MHAVGHIVVDGVVGGDIVDVDVDARCAEKASREHAGGKGSRGRKRRGDPLQIGHILKGAVTVHNKDSLNPFLFLPCEGAVPHLLAEDHIVVGIHVGHVVDARGEAALELRNGGSGFHQPHHAGQLGKSLRQRRPVEKHLAWCLLRHDPEADHVRWGGRHRD